MRSGGCRSFQVALVVGACVELFPLIARAEEPAPTGTSSAEVSAPADARSTPPRADVPDLRPAEDPEWNREFDRARATFLAGQFRSAAEQLRSLIPRTSSPIARARAAELLHAADEWARRDVTLIEQRELAGSDVLARRTDRRTADEIGVLYLASIGYGLGTGIWLDILAEPDSAAGAILPPLLVSAGAAGTVAMLDRGKGLRYGSAQSIATGMTLGFYQGFAWTTYYQATSKYDEQLDPEGYATALWLSTTAGAVTGGAIGALRSTTPGRAAFVGSATLWPALVLGLAGAGFSADDAYRDDHALLASAFGATAGMVGGIFAAGPVSPTTARVRFLDLGALAGGLAVGGLTLAARAEETEDGREIFLATDVGILAGLGLAWWLTTGMPKDLGAENPAPPPLSVTPALAPQPGGFRLAAVGTF